MMIKEIKKFLGICLVASITIYSFDASAGNKDRIGQSGTPELLINPWVGSSSFGGANSSSVTGLEAMRLNVSGLNFINNTEIAFARKTWVKNTGINGGVNINAFGLAQRVGESGVAGISVMAMDFGDIPITTVNQPEGGIGTYSPSFTNLGLSYARAFSNAIYGGLTVRAISQALPNAKVSGMAFDAGIRYITGKQENLKFGIALRNVGPKLRFEGDGFATKIQLDGKEFTLEQRTVSFEMPAILNIGVSYDVYLGDSRKYNVADEGVKGDMHRITGAFTFTSNSFGKDQIRVGAEYAFKEMIMARASLVYENGIFDDINTSTAFNGPSFGVSYYAKIGKSENKFIIDYEYKPGNPFQVHGIGFKLSI